MIDILISQPRPSALNDTSKSILRGFQQADELCQMHDNTLLEDLPERDPMQLYGGLITLLMRLVFLLYAEDEALMPTDDVYEQNYKVSAIFEQLQQDLSAIPRPTRSSITFRNTDSCDIRCIHARVRV